MALSISLLRALTCFAVQRRHSSILSNALPITLRYQSRFSLGSEVRSAKTATDPVQKGLSVRTWADIESQRSVGDAAVSVVVNCWRVIILPSEGELAYHIWVWLQFRRVEGHKLSRIRNDALADLVLKKRVARFKAAYGR